MTAQHTPRKLTLFRQYAETEVRFKDGALLAVIREVVPQDRIDARRLVATWNACEGITTERLEDLGRPLMQHLIGCDERAARMVKDREELLAAAVRAEAFISGFDDDNKADDITGMLRDLRAAIQKATHKEQV